MGRTKEGGVREWDAEVGVWTADGGSERRQEKIEENEIGGACGMCGTQYKCVGRVVNKLEGRRLLGKMGR